MTPSSSGLLELQPGSRISVAGTVGAWESRRRTSGEIFIKAFLHTDDGGAIRCVWWDARRAPMRGSRVVVEGEVRSYEGSPELHVRDTRPLVETPPQSFEHRLLRYYIACLEAERMRAVEFDPASAGRSFVVLNKGPELLLTGYPTTMELPADPTIMRWCRTQSMAGKGEQSYAGFPVVVGERDIDGHSVRRIGPLFYVPISLKRRGAGYEAHPEDTYPELNGFALDLLGLDRDEREGLLRAVEQLEGFEEEDPKHPLDRMREWLYVLKSEGLLPQGYEISTDSLEPLREETGISNTEILYSSERGAVIRNLLRDLEEMAGLPPEQLRTGPLGVLIGAQQILSKVPARPQPCVLPSNLSQDEAITNALESPFTVVTGPPGTGKSQVLVNTVAAAMAQGETVLFASKNNQAVDVVFERVAGISSLAAPIRAGAARLRSEVAGRIQTALARPAESADLAGAVEEWRALEAELWPVYAQAHNRRLLEAGVREWDRAFASALSSFSTGIERIASPGRLAWVLEECRRLFPLLGRRRPILPWARARFRQDQERLLGLWGEIRRAFAAVWPSLRMPEVPDERWLTYAQNIVTAASQLSYLRQNRDSTKARLAGLPERWQLEDRLAEYTSRRLDTGRRLFRACWVNRLFSADIRTRQFREAAERFAEGFARLGRGERAEIGRLLASLPDVLSVFPIWGVTNLSARVNFPLQSGLFDLVIIDEASQCDIPSAIPLLFRAKRALIIGDPNQLIHVTSLRSSRDRDIARRWGMSEPQWERFSYSQVSLFGLASRAWGQEPIFLDRHFRSRLAIIAFSNDHFYGSRLEVLTEESDAAGPAVQWVDVKGRFERGPGGRSVLNAPEVSAVVEELGRLAYEKGLEGATFGVVTPYRAQVDAIRERVATVLPDLVDRLTVASAHRFQGDERDVIVFSPTVSPEMPSRSLRFASDPNLVNVALTRARKRLVVVGDFEACLASRTVLADLAKYIEGMEKGRFRSPCELELYEALVAAGVPVRVGVEVDGSLLDLAVELGDRRIDVEVDGAAYHRDARADALRDQRLEAAGWKVLRFAAREVRADARACAQRVVEALR